MIWMDGLEDGLEAGVKRTKELFRELHSWPELGNHEYKTAALIGEELKSLGLTVWRPSGTSVVCDIEGAGKETIAFRADIDALPIVEEVMVGYRSRRAGMMHACGHDAHTAILLGAGRMLCQLERRPECKVRLIFQPNEEGQGGADQLIEAGVTEGVKAIFGFHVMPSLPAGTVGLKYGTVHGESRTFRIGIQGRKAHGAKPDSGVDAIYCSAELISLCQSIISRKLSPLEHGVITFGTICGGDKGNIIPDYVEIEGIVRGDNSAVCDRLCEQMKAISSGLRAAFDAEINLEFMAGCKALVNDSRLVEVIKQAARCPVAELRQHSLTVDDFSAYLQKLPGAFFFLGSGFEDRENGGLHTGKFRVNEECLGVGVETLLRICYGI